MCVILIRFEHLMWPVGSENVKTSARKIEGNDATGRREEKMSFSVTFQERVHNSGDPDCRPDEAKQIQLKDFQTSILKRNKGRLIEVMLVNSKLTKLKQNRDMNQNRTKPL